MTRAGTRNIFFFLLGLKLKLKFSLRLRISQIEGSRHTLGIWHLCRPWGGEFDHYTYGVGNLNSNLDFVLHVPVSEHGLINYGGLIITEAADMRSKMANLRILKEKIATLRQLG